ncbi:MAG: hypothetical protein DBX44_02010 [Oscillospiraceae bacterium]|nr:MAG: hypothetical protein DBX44_02010 [Oscillospiraceae bacterium]
MGANKASKSSLQKKTGMMAIPCPCMKILAGHGGFRYTEGDGSLILQVKKRLMPDRTGGEK